MLVRFRVRLSLLVYGPRDRPLHPAISFQHKRYALNVTFQSGDPIQATLPDLGEAQFATITSVTVTVGETQRVAGRLAGFLPEGRRQELGRLLLGIANRILGAIRNFGGVALLNEIRVKPADTERLLAEWSVETSEDGAAWTGLYPAPTMLDLLGRRESQGPQLASTGWPQIQEALEDELEAGPEQEFLTNAIEHLRLQNLRLALLEAVICLEIVSARYLKTLLRVKRELDRESVARALEIELMPRIGLLVPLLYADPLLSAVSMALVLQGITWRNKIVHRTGHLPDGVQDEAIESATREVLALALVLAVLERKIEAEPRLTQIAAEIAARWEVPQPSIREIDHRRIIQFEFFLANPFPNEERMRQIAGHASARFQALDPRFNPDRDLYVSFLDFPQQLIAKWAAGNLDVLKPPRTHFVHLPAPPPAPPVV